MRELPILASLQPIALPSSASIDPSVAEKTTLTFQAMPAVLCGLVWIIS
jgi:hypothetical protein